MGKDDAAPEVRTEKDELAFQSIENRLDMIGAMTTLHNAISALYSGESDAAQLHLKESAGKLRDLIDGVTAEWVELKEKLK